MTAYIVTGTTRGIGRGLAAAILESGHDLFSISSAASHSDGKWRNLHCDLRQINEVDNALQRLMDPIAESASDDGIVLINNAGTLAPMGPLETATPDQIMGHLNVNLGAPAVLMSRFIQLTEVLSQNRRIINISSGAARHPYDGWALYCASKAALDMLTRCAAAEQRQRSHSVCVSTVYPGKVDTGMQRQIRESDPTQFSTHARFVRAKERGELLSPDHVARLIVALDIQGQMENGGRYDLRLAHFDSNGRVVGLVTV